MKLCPGEWDVTSADGTVSRTTVVTMTLDYASTLPIVANAQLVAESVHRKQMYGNRPFVWHLEQVAQLVMDHHESIGGWWPHAVATAYLHDLVEDHPDKFHFMVGHMPDVITGFVCALTRREGQTPKSYFSGIACAGTIAVAVKLADRIANLRACLSPEMRKPRLAAKYLDEREVFAVMKPSSRDLGAIWDELERLYEAIPPKPESPPQE